MTALHRTPVHHQMLTLVQSGFVEWRQDRGAFGRFTRLGGKELEPGQLVALHEFERERWIQRAGPTVTATHVGASRLSEWGPFRG